MVKSFDWSPERVEQLKDFVLKQSLSHSQIAKIMGCTRSSALGKWHRMCNQDPTLRRISPNTPWKLREPVAPKPKKSKAVEVVPPSETEPLQIDGAFVQLVDLTSNTCRYPIGDPLSSDFKFCGQGVDGRSPYCPVHHKVCLVALPPRKDRHGKHAA